ncbi:Hsp20/alpha crystallin family protein [Desulfobacter hydrogenophilus]|uniref:Hsp20/alpha crystallin family protein n=1 Tax=Desulfobacter hydrogenophilus TaxID=2291 RepID=A0A328FJ47_9BACT|nr:Hsp20/alpha crystallin family protein [Desulfobacter hydrogenophilus]NDY70877.1 Hsp20/alpha crystallin family protein [Desulfobacter hydrogenophilus]QBH11647.1 Hsp20/alpha crystallin family protein [Desulfobacter hydrogenophilus]RAM03193.1 Hsp20/alpha crystallin family protein [Desulfobacter hydrogenophilus]
MFTRFGDIDRLFGTMNLLQRKLDNLYGAYGRPSGYKWELESAVPKTNLYEHGDNFEIKAEVPGLEKNNLNVKIQGNYLEISGERRSDAPEGYKTHKTERGVGSFSRSFTLPADVDSTKVKATLKDGVLYLTLPKHEAAKPKKISIN